MERSLVIIKPDAMKRNLATTILSRFEQQGLKLIALKMIHISEALASKHYYAHKDKPFYDELIEFISSSPVIAAVFQGEHAVEVIRNIMGTTDPSQAEVGTTRADFGLDIQRNAVHGSDSIETANQEIALFFSESELFD